MAVCTMGLQPCLAGGRAGEETVFFLDAQVHMVLICAQSGEILVWEIKQIHKLNASQKNILSGMQYLFLTSDQNMKKKSYK